MSLPVWTSLTITTLCISLVALLASLVSLWFGWRNHVRAEAQDQRRRPKLEIDLRRSQVRPASSAGRLYCFQIQIRNPTDVDNAISLIELRILFHLIDGTELIARIEHKDAGFPGELGEALSIPTKIGAHNIVTGWCAFDLRDDLVGDKTIEGFTLEIHDTHSLVSKLEPRIVQFPPERTA